MDQSFSSYYKVVESKMIQPQANVICKCMHQPVDNILRTLLHGKLPQHVTKACVKDFIGEVLFITMHTKRAGTHSTLGSSPGSLVFNRDMFLTIQLIAVTGMPSHNDNSIWSMRTSCMKRNTADMIMSLLIEY